MWRGTSAQRRGIVVDVIRICRGTGSQGRGTAVELGRRPRIGASWNCRGTAVERALWSVELPWNCRGSRAPYCKTARRRKVRSQPAFSLENSVETRGASIPFSCAPRRAHIRSHPRPRPTGGAGSRGDATVVGGRPENGSIPKGGTCAGAPRSSSQRPPWALALVWPWPVDRSRPGRRHITKGGQRPRPHGLWPWNDSPGQCPWGRRARRAYPHAFPGAVQPADAPAFPLCGRQKGVCAHTPCAYGPLACATPGARGSRLDRVSAGSHPTGPTAGSGGVFIRRSPLWLRQARQAARTTSPVLSWAWLGGAAGHQGQKGVQAALERPVVRPTGPATEARRPSSLAITGSMVQPRSG